MVHITSQQNCLVVLYSDIGHHKTLQCAHAARCGLLVRHTILLCPLHHYADDVVDLVPKSIACMHVHVYMQVYRCAGVCVWMGEGEARAQGANRLVGQEFVKLGNCEGIVTHAIQNMAMFVRASACVSTHARVGGGGMHGGRQRCMCVSQRDSLAHLRVCRRAQHGDDLSQALPGFLLGDDELEHSDASTTLAVPIVWVWVQSL